MHKFKNGISIGGRIRYGKAENDAYRIVAFVIEYHGFLKPYHGKAGGKMPVGRRGVCQRDSLGQYDIRTVLAYEIEHTVQVIYSNAALPEKKFACRDNRFFPAGCLLVEKDGVGIDKLVERNQLMRRFVFFLNKDR